MNIRKDQSVANQINEQKEWDRAVAYYDLYNQKQDAFTLEQKIKADVKNGDFARIQYLFTEKFDLTNSHLGLLHIATRNGRIEIMELLIAAGADVNALDKYNYSPLVSALRHHQSVAASLLIVMKANPNICSADDNLSPLHHAVLNDHDELVQELIDAGAHLNAKTLEEENTPLHLAVMNGSKEMVKLLLRLGANPFIQNKHGKKPADLIDNRVRHEWYKIFGKLKPISREPSQFSSKPSASLNSIFGGPPQRRISTLTQPQLPQTSKTPLGHHPSWIWKRTALEVPAAALNLVRRALKK